MQNIYLKKGMVTGQSEEYTYPKLIKIVLDYPPDGGFKYSDYKERARVENAMDKIQTDDQGEFFQLEDRDAKNLTDWVARTKWNIRDPFIFEFCDMFDKLKLR
jgi:hypothetical protein